MNKLYDDKKLTLQFSLFVIIQPFIDIYRIFVGNRFEFFGISLVELFNIALIGYLAILFILNKKRIKAFVPAFVYGVVLVGYLALHCYNMLKFDTTIINGTSINIFSEIYIIVRAYVLPLMLIYMLVSVKTDKDRFLKTIYILCWIITAVIIVTNIFKVSFVSYASGLEKNEFIRQNIIEWLTKKPPEDIRLITSKGWFYSGNQIGLILFMLYPISIYIAYTNKKAHNFIQVFLQSVSMSMVATKTAAFGSVLVLGCMLAMAIFFFIVSKKFRENLKTILIMIVILGCSVGVLKISPVMTMSKGQSISYEKTKEEKALENEMKEAVEDSESSKNDPVANKKFIKYMYKYYYIYGIQEEYIKLFPVEKNHDFWVSVITDPNKRQINFRDFKGRIFDEVSKQNDNELDKYLGIGYTTNFPYLEKDIVAQNAWFGLAGTALLVMPYFALLAYCCFKILLKLKQNFNFINCTLIVSLVCGIGGCLIAGHLFGYLFPIIIFSYILSQLFHSTKTSKNNQE